MKLQKLNCNSLRIVLSYLSQVLLFSFTFCFILFIIILKILYNISTYISYNLTTVNSSEWGEIIGVKPNAYYYILAISLEITFQPIAC